MAYTKYSNQVESLKMWEPAETLTYSDLKLLRYLTAPADYLDARATKLQILKISYQLG